MGIFINPFSACGTHEAVGKPLTFTANQPVLRFQPFPSVLQLSKTRSLRDSSHHPSGFCQVMVLLSFPGFPHLPSCLLFTLSPFSSLPFPTNRHLTQCFCVLPVGNQNETSCSSFRLIAGIPSLVSIKFYFCLIP